MKNAPIAEQNFVKALCDHLVGLVGRNLVTIYLLGAASPSAYAQGQSDLYILGVQL